MYCVLTVPFPLQLTGNAPETDSARLYSKAIDLFRHFELNPTAVAGTWSALGSLYVNKRRYVAGNALLTRGQSCDPKLPLAWMGQAWCAERLGHALEAMDLTRHAASLGSAVGLANKLIRLALSVIIVLLCI